MAGRRMLAFAAASGRVGYVLLVGDRLMDWRMSSKAARAPENAAEVAQKWINDLKPDVVVTEKVEEAARKGNRTKAVVSAIARVAEHNYVLDVSVTRAHQHPSKYEEAADLAERYPDIEAWLPTKRLFYENEPRNTVLFEALSLAEAVLRGPNAAHKPAT